MMDPKLVWSRVFGSYCIGDKVRVREDSNWVWKGYVGRIVDICIAEGIPRFLLRCRKTRGNNSKNWDDPHLYGYFRFEDLELI